MTSRRAAPGLALGVLLDLAATLAPARAYGLDPHRAMSQYVRDRWDRDRGLSGGPVRALAQGADGYLWIGTDQGLVRFDGLQFVHVRGPESLPSGVAQVLGLAAGPGGDLWVRRAGAALHVHRDGAFVDALPSLDPKEDAFTSMSAARGGGVLLAGLVSGILRSTRDGLETLAPSVAVRSTVIALAEAPDGTVWLGTRDAGLFHLRDGRLRSVARGLPDRKVNCLLAVGADEVWIGTDKGVVRWDGRALVTAGVPPPVRRIRALAMTKDDRSNVWIGASTGLWRVTAAGAAALDPHPGSKAGVTALLEDRQGNLWVGGERGIERLRDSRFAAYGTAEGLPSQRIGPVHADAEGRTWFAPAAGGLYWLEGGRVEPVRAAGLDRDVVYSIAGGHDGVWVGRRHGGLTHLRLREGRLAVRTLTPRDGLPGESVYAVHVAADGSVWAGSLGGGASRLHEGRLATFTTSDGLAAGTVASIVDDREGTTWFATPHGLSALSREGWRTYGTRDGLPSDEVTCLLVGSSGVLWIGTGDGLAFRGSSRIERVPLAPHSPNEQVLGLADDERGSLWVATSRRVLRVGEAGVRDGSAGPVEVTEFGRADGLRGVEGVRRHRSLVADGLGRVWVSTDGGLSVVDPAGLGHADQVSARTLSVTADGSALSLQGSARVPAARHRVTFRFDGVSLSAPERLRFRYRLDGFDHEWSEPTAVREASYTNLPPGPYAFRVRAYGLGEGWIGPEHALGLAVAPALWQRGWVQVAALLVGAAGLVGAYRLRVQHVVRRLNLRFEDKLSERLRIAQELHDSLLQGVVSASLQLHVAVEQLASDSPTRPLLERVQQLITQTIDEGRDTVRGLRFAPRDPGDLAEAFARVRAELAEPSPASLRVVVQGPPRKLRPAVRDEVYGIGREALVNAIRHSAASRVEVGLEYGSRELRLVVRDDGCGIDPEVLRSGKDGHFGLSGMRERAERVGGRLAVWSAPGAGTEVVLNVRGALAFEPSPATGLLARLKRRGSGTGPEGPTRPEAGQAAG